MILRNSVFVYRSRARWGGGLVAVERFLIVTENDVLFQNCTTFEDSGAGSAILLSSEGGSVFHDTRFVGGYSCCDAALYIQLGVSLQMHNCQFVDNVAVDGHSGAIFLRANSGAAVLEHVDFIRNKAFWQSGAVSLRDSTTLPILIKSCRFEENEAGIGGAIDSAGRTTIEDCVFSGNRAFEDAGAIRFRGDAVATVHGSVFTNNEAGLGGCLQVVESAKLTLNNTFLDGCISHENGGALACAQFAELDLGGISVTNSHAARFGGGIYVECTRTDFFHDSVISGNTAGMQGGGMTFASQVRSDAKLLNISFNTAVGNGGGLVGLGSGARFTIGLETMLHLEENEAGQDGGGIALLQDAQVEVEQHQCPDTCQPVDRGDNACNFECLSPGCNWDEGRCTINFEEAGSSASTPCDRDVCSFNWERHPSLCYSHNCGTASCDWGKGYSPQCDEFLSYYAKCPAFSATTYASLHEQAGLTFVKGGNSRDFGRCGSECTTDANRTEPFCVLLDDGGQIMEQLYINDFSAYPVGEAWGYCQSRPRLPYFGWEYDSIALIEQSRIPTFDMMKRNMSCGIVPLVFLSNKARHGAGMYKDGCTPTLSTMGKCFVGGIGQQHSSITVHFQDNLARGHGGGLATGCVEMEQCAALLDHQVYLPSSFGSRQMLFNFQNNEAAAYGDDMATNAWELSIIAFQQSLIPGIDQLNVSFQITDSLGQTVRGSEFAPSAILLEVRVCAVGSSCGLQDALQPSIFVPMRPTDTLTSTLDSGRTLGVCPAQHDAVEVLLVLNGDAFNGRPLLQKRIRIQCSGCKPGQAYSVSKMSRLDMSVWECSSCPADTYVLATGNSTSECQNCPRGAVCRNGHDVHGVTPGSSWEPDLEQGVVRLISCPRGHFRDIYLADGSFYHDGQQCAKCPAGFHCPDEVCEECQPCPAGYYKEAEGDHSCSSCQPDTFNPFLGQKSQSSCVRCPAGSSTSGKGAQTDIQSCVCENMYYAREEEGQVVCETCPVGARCMDASCALAREDKTCPAGDDLMIGTWSRQENGIFRVTGCEAGFVLVRSKFNVDRALDQCIECPINSYSVTDAQYPHSMTSDTVGNASNLCQPCTTGVLCKGGRKIVAEDNFWIPEEFSIHGGRRAGIEVKAYRCQDNACKDGGCVEGRAGLICGTCAKGLSRVGGDCTECPNSALPPVGWVVLAFVVFLFVATSYFQAFRPAFQKEELSQTHEGNLLSVRPVPEDVAGSPSMQSGLFKIQGMALAVIRSSIVDFTKVTISYFQVSSTFSSVYYTVSFPSVMKTFWAFTAIVRIDFLSVPHLQCIGKTWRMAEILHVATFMPMAVVMFWSIPTLIMTWQRDTRSVRFKSVVDGFSTLSIIWLYLLYPTLCVLALRGFECREIEGVNVLVSDVKISCPLDNPRSLEFLLSLLCTVLYPIGIPLLFFLILHWNKVPEMAKRKRENATMQEMISVFRAREGRKITCQIAALFNQCADIGRDRTELFAAAEQMYVKATAKGSNSLTAQDFLNHLKSLGTQKPFEGDTSELLNKFDSNEKGYLTLPEFVEMISFCWSNRVKVTGEETVATIDREKLEQLCLFSWSRLFEELDESRLRHSAKKALALLRKRNLRFESLSNSRRERQNNESFSVPKPALRDHAVSPEDSDSSLPTWKTLSSNNRAIDYTVHSPNLRCIDPYTTKEEMLQFLLRVGNDLIAQEVLSKPWMQWDGTDADERNALERVGWLFGSYKVEYWYMELLEMGRKFLSTTLMVFVFPRSPNQIASGFIFLLLCMIHALKTRPFSTPLVNMLHLTSLGTMAFTLFSGIMILVADARQFEQQAEKTMLAYILFILNSLMFTAPFWCTFFEKGILRRLQTVLVWSNLRSRGERDDKETQTEEFIVEPTRVKLVERRKDESPPLSSNPASPRSGGGVAALRGEGATVHAPTNTRTAKDHVISECEDEEELFRWTEGGIAVFSSHITTSVSRPQTAAAAVDVEDQFPSAAPPSQRTGKQDNQGEEKSSDWV